MNMLIKRKNSFLLTALLMAMISFAQNKPAVYKIDDLLKRIHNKSDTIYVVNFWATWCKPCVQELPDFENFTRQNKPARVKVLLVSLDFKEDMDQKLVPFLQSTGYTSEVVLLDETNGEIFINKIHKSWSGVIPSTYFTTKNKKKEVFISSKVNLDMLNSTMNDFLK
jgi:thiol-disulfide isomerase/thioredoxin